MFEREKSAIKNADLSGFVQGDFQIIWLLWVLTIHAVGLIGGYLLFSWSAWHFGAISMVLFAYSMGIIHHMLPTHRSFKCKKWIENLGALLGTLTWRGPFANPIRYVAMHRVHHAYADTDLDPHSPIHGLMHAMMGWFWYLPKVYRSRQEYEQLVPDLANDSWMKLLDSKVHLIQFFWGILCFLVGAFVPYFAGSNDQIDFMNGLRFVVFGVFVKTLLVLYIANSVDLINHKFGYRNYETGDLSTNSRIMALFHWGGAVSWHNNHHAEPTFFSVKRNSWEFDFHCQLLRVIERLGWVWEITRKVDTK